MTAPTPPTPQNRSETLIRNAYRVQLISTIAMAAISILSTILTIALREYIYVGTVLMGVLALTGLAGLYLHRRGRPFAGVYGLAGAIMLAGLALPILVNGSSITIGLAIILMVAGLATYALPPDRIGRVILIAAISGSTSVLIDLYTPFYFAKSNPTATLAFTVLLAIVYTVFIVRRFRTFPVRAKLLVTGILIAIVPLIVFSIYNNFTISRRLESDARTSLSVSANQAAANIDALLKGQLDTVRAEARLPQMAAFLQTPQYQLTAEDKAGMLGVFSALQRRDPIYISSYALLDRLGRVVMDTDSAEIGANKSDRDYFIQARDTKLPFVSTVRYSPTTGNASFYVSAPINDQSGQFLGVLRVRYDADLLQYALASISLAQTGSATGAEIVLVDSTYYFILADTGQPDNIGRSYIAYSDEQTAELQDAGAVPASATAVPTTNQPELAAALAGSGENPVFLFPAPAEEEEDLLIGTARVEPPGWIVMVAEPTSLITVPVANQARGATTLLIIAVAFAALAAWLASIPIAGPIVRLTETAQAITAGDLKARAKVETEDEIGALAYSFNQMTGQLSETLTGLESRVSARTAELEESSRESAKRAESLAAISEVSRAIAAEQDLDKLLPLITRVVSERFSFYHVGIFLLDDQRQNAVLRAANSEGGQRMLSRGHRLKVGQEGIVGFVTGTGRPRIALDVGQDATFFNNPDLPLTRSEMALPLVLRGQAIGALDVQSTAPQAFTTEDTDTLGVLAAQVAIAIDNARLFGETRMALAEAQTLYSEYQAQAWQHVIRRQGTSGFRHSPSGGQVIERPVQRPDIEQAVVSGDVIVTQPGQGEGPALTAPIMLRDKVIGVLSVRAENDSHRWSAEEIELVRSVAGRVALALENARLLEETRQRANRERLVAEITTRIRSSNDPQIMMQTAVEELKTALGASRVEIIPQTVGESKRSD